MSDRTPRLPTVSHLQYLALGLLRQRDRPGRELRDEAGLFGVRRSAAAFYQMMARLERDHLVEGWYEQVHVGDQAVTERHYRITPAGARAWDRTRAFHEAVAAAGSRRWSNA